MGWGGVGVRVRGRKPLARSLYHPPGSENTNTIQPHDSDPSMRGGGWGLEQEQEQE